MINKGIAFAIARGSWRGLAPGGTARSAVQSEQFRPAIREFHAVLKRTRTPGNPGITSVHSPRAMKTQSMPSRTT
jgi:hypothetical protein